MLILWNDSEEQRSFYLAAWDMIKLPFQQGGLGLDRLLSSTKISSRNGFGDHKY